MGMWKGLKFSHKMKFIIQSHGTMDGEDGYDYDDDDVGFDEEWELIKYLSSPRYLHKLSDFIDALIQSKCLNLAQFIGFSK
jgi:hypothetical protein